MSRDAAAGVLDLERDGLLPRRGAQHDAAFPRVLDRVGEEVQEHARELLPVEYRRIGEFGRQLQEEGDPLGPRLRLEHVGHLAQKGAQLHPLGIEVPLTRLDFGEVEDVVDHAKQCLRALADDGDVMKAPLLVARRRAFPFDDVREQDDRVQGRAQLVRDRREEIRLEPVEFRELLVRLGVLLDRSPLLADRAADADQGADAGAELRALDRFADEVVRAGGISPFPVDRARRHEQHRKVFGRARDQLAGQLVAGVRSQHDVHDGEIELAVLREKRRDLREAADGHDLVAVHFEIGPDEIRDLRLVVHDEDPAVSLVPVVGRLRRRIAGCGRSDFLSPAAAQP